MNRFNALVDEFNAFIAAHPRLGDMGDALELLMGAELTPDEFQWLTAFCERWDAMMEASLTARDIAKKWVDRIGYGFHPDTTGADYVPALSPAEVAEYDADMDVLFDQADPYETAVEAMHARFPEGDDQ